MTFNFSSRTGLALSHVPIIPKISVLVFFEGLLALSPYHVLALFVPMSSLSFYRKVAYLGPNNTGGDQE